MAAERRCATHRVGHGQEARKLQPHSSQMPVAGSVIEHVGQIAGGVSRAAVARATGVRVVRGARGGAVRDADGGSDTSKPRLRRIATAPCLSLLNSSGGASRPVAKRWATPRIAPTS